MELLQNIELYRMDYKLLMVFSFLYFILFGIAEVAYHFFDVKVEYTRKFVHAFTGIITLLFPIYIANIIDLIILCGSFLCIVFVTKNYNLLQSVNAIERKSNGSILFPIVVIICYIIESYMQNYVYFLIPILILSFADPIAAIVGKKWPKGKYSIRGNHKTLAGSLAFLFTAFLISILTVYLIGNLLTVNRVLLCFILAMVTTVGEAISIRGYDNLWIPLSCIITLLFFQV